MAQVETWASDVHVRHFWGVTELNDYDTNCAEMSNNALHSFVETCLGTMGWEYNIETFRQKLFGVASGYGKSSIRQAGTALNVDRGMRLDGSRHCINM